MSLLTRRAADAGDRLLSPPSRAPLGRRGGVGLFRLGVALIALHVIDDSFLQPQRGTSAADHLVSGLVPLAALGARGVGATRACAAAPRRARADARRVRPRRAAARPSTTAARSASGDDYSGLLAIPAGLLLLGLGVSTLWRTRRMDRWRSLRRPLLGVAGLIVFLFGVLPVGMSYVNVHVGRAVVPAPHLGAPHENVTLTTSDGLKLQGLVRPVAQRRRRDRLPGPQGPAAAHADARPPRLRRAAARPPRRGRERGRADVVGLGRRARPARPRSRSCSSAPDVDRGRIGGLGLSVGGELMIEAAASTPGAEGRRVRGRRHAIDSRADGHARGA